MTAADRTAGGPVDGAGSPDPVLVHVATAIGLGARHDRAAARDLLVRVWREIGGAHGDALHRCAVAHSMADVQDDPAEELRWDLEALAAADVLSDARVAEAGIAGPAAAFSPSLHLNVAECYRKLGDAQRASAHLRRGRESLPALPDDGYAAMIRHGLDRLEEALGPSEPA